MSRNTLYLVIGLLAVVVVAAAIYFVYQEQQRPTLEITVNEDGLRIQ